MTWDIDYLALAPEITIALTLLGVLGLDLVLPRRNKYFTAIVGLLGLVVAGFFLVFLATDPAGTRSLFEGSYVVDDFALVLKGLFVVSGYLVLLMSVSYIESERYYQGEYYFLLIASILGSIVMSSARDLIVLFIGLELVTGPLFMLAGWRKGDMKSNEASVKYFILGVLSTAILLWGMSMLFGLTGAVTFDGIASGIADVPAEQEALLGLAVIFILVGFGFKVSAVPFHFWAPDTYEGAPTPVTAYLSVSSKVAGFVGLFVMLYLALPTQTEVWGPGLWALAALSMTVANLSALRQTNIVRLLAYSSIAQAGFMLVPFAAAAVSGEGVGDGLEATVIYLVIYALMNLGAFAIVIQGARRMGSGEIDGWAGLGRVDPQVGVLAAIFFFSLAGIPPLAGWFAKFVMFRSAITAGTIGAGSLAVIAAINSVIAFYYYARVIKVVWFDEPAEDYEPREVPAAGSLALAVGISAAATIVIGIYPTISAFFGEATRTLTAAIGG